MPCRPAKINWDQGTDHDAVAAWFGSISDGSIPDGATGFIKPIGALVHPLASLTFCVDNLASKLSVANPLRR